MNIRKTKKKQINQEYTKFFEFVGFIMTKVGQLQ